MLAGGVTYDVIGIVIIVLIWASFVVLLLALGRAAGAADIREAEISATQADEDPAAANQHEREPSTTSSLADIHSKVDCPAYVYSARSSPLRPRPYGSAMVARSHLERPIGRRGTR